MAVFTKTIRKHIFLHPMDKNRGSAAVKSTLLQDKNKYSHQLEGSLLDVKRVKVIGDRYLVVNGYLSMEVVADCVVFSPKVGQTLEGVINKKSKSHLGCLVMDTFNAALVVPDSFGFDPQVGNSCTFVVTKVVVDGNIPFLRGTLASLTSYENTTNLFTEIEDMSMEEDATANKLSQLKTEDNHSTTENDSVIEIYNSDNERAMNNHSTTENDSVIEIYNSDNERAMNVLPKQHRLRGGTENKSKKSPNKVKK